MPRIKKARTRCVSFKNAAIDLQTGDLLSKLLEVANIRADYIGEIDIALIRRCMSPLKRLHKMIGIWDVKKRVAMQVLYFAQGMYSDQDYLNCAIYGPPGTGKTETAHIIGGIYSKLGILKKNVF